MGVFKAIADLVKLITDVIKAALEVVKAALKLVKNVLKKTADLVKGKEKGAPKDKDVASKVKGPKSPPKEGDAPEQEEAHEGQEREDDAPDQNEESQDQSVDEEEQDGEAPPSIDLEALQKEAEEKEAADKKSPMTKMFADMKKFVSKLFNTEKASGGSLEPQADAESVLQDGAEDAVEAPDLAATSPAPAEKGGPKREGEAASGHSGEDKDKESADADRESPSKKRVGPHEVSPKDLQDAMKGLKKSGVSFSEAKEGDPRVATKEKSAEQAESKGAAERE